MLLSGDNTRRELCLDIAQSYHSNCNFATRETIETAVNAADTIKHKIDSGEIELPRGGISALAVELSQADLALHNIEKAEEYEGLANSKKRYFIPKFRLKRELARAAW